MRPGPLSVRAANEYRGRDLMGYLSLRHLFRASSARTDRWATEVAVDLTTTRTSLPYRTNLVYRGVRSQGEERTLEYRELHFPGPTEMLAEAALLAACNQAGGSFDRHPSVYSNVLSQSGARHGMVDPYFIWWKRRQDAIAEAARENPRGLVAYFDIRKFYESLSYSLVNDAWLQCSRESGLPTKWRALGAKLLADYRQIKQGKDGLLAGPMFAHIVGNLILRPLDVLLSTAFPGRYFRYVDDIAVVIDSDSLADARDKVARALPPGLKLHDEKTLTLGCLDWVRLTESFSREAHTYQWARLIGGIKYFLATQDKGISELARLFKENGFRIPLRDYRRSVTDLPFVERLLSRYRRRFATGQDFPRSPKALLDLALSARAAMQTQFDRFAAETPQHGMRRKFQLQKLRYAATRLLYLGHPEAIRSNGSQLEGIHELSDLWAIYTAIHFSDVSELLSFSSSVAQAGAQVLALSGQSLRCRVETWRPELQSAWSVLSVSGVRFSSDATRPPATPLVDFAVQNRHTTSADPYFQEIFALARGTPNSHKDFLQVAFDHDEDLVLDAIRSLRASS